MCTSPEGTSMCHARMRGMGNASYAPLIPGCNNSTKRGIGTLDLIQNFVGSIALESCWSYASEASGSGPGGD